MPDHLLSIIVFLPLFFAGVLLLVPRRVVRTVRAITLGALSLNVALAGYLYALFLQSGEKLSGITSAEDFVFYERADWLQLDLGSLGGMSITYALGLDGLNFSLFLLAIIVLWIGALASWNVKEQPRAYFALYLLLSTSVLGCFVALDFFLFYLFFEFMLLPMYFLIGMWGGKRREYAALKFFIYTLVGSLLILIGGIALYSSVIDPVKTAVAMGLAPEQTAQVYARLAEGGEGLRAELVRTFDLVLMTQPQNFLPDGLLHPDQTGSETNFRYVVFWLIFIGFAIKLPAVPFHTWLPDAHVEAPTPISVVLAGVLLKVGGYGVLRLLFPVLPDAVAAFSWWIGFFGVVSIVYGAFVALGQQQLKRLIAYSSVAHMGFVLIGMASMTVEGIDGAVYQMVSHGFISALLFLVVGVLYDRTHQLEISSYGGLYRQMPAYTVFVTIGFFASLGLPGFSGFVAELFTILGVFNSELPKYFSFLALLGILISAVYYLWTLRRVFMGEFWVRADINPEKLKDLTPLEWATILPLVFFIVFFGLFPQPLFDLINEASYRMVELFPHAVK